jgi:hypothetical protein
MRINGIHPCWVVSASVKALIAWAMQTGGRQDRQAEIAKRIIHATSEKKDG